MRAFVCSERPCWRHQTSNVSSLNMLIASFSSYVFLFVPITHEKVSFLRYHGAFVSDKLPITVRIQLGFCRLINMSVATPKRVDRDSTIASKHATLLTSKVEWVIG